MRNCGFLYCSFVWLITQATHYELLNIPHTATQKEIRSAYLGRAKEIHPDRSLDENATRLFQELGNAYATLKDPELRNAYDAMLQNENTETDIDYTRCSCFNSESFTQWTIFFFAPCINTPHIP